MAHLGTLPVTGGERWPQRPAFRLDDAVLSYAQLDALTAYAAGLLHARGVGPGDRVALMLPNVPHFPVLYYGALRAGAVVVPLNPLLQAREIRHCLTTAGARLLAVWEPFAPVARQAAAQAGTECIVISGTTLLELSATAPYAAVEPRDASDTAVILFTSGTTGRPKGAELSHDNLLGNAEVSARTLTQLTPDDVLLGALPFFHVFGQTCALNAAILSGSCVTLLPRFDPQQALRVLDRDRVTVFEGVPTMYAAMLLVPEHDRFDTSALRLCVTGGAPMPVEVLKSFEQTFECIVLEGYGLSETSPVVAFNHPDRQRKPGTIGTAVEGVEVRLVGMDGRDVADGEVGEIAVRGPNVMKGYYGEPAASAQTIRDGWLFTGDLATRDSEGYLTIVDRLKDMIIRGGFNVYPREVEEVLYEHPAVAEAAVVGVPDPLLGEEVAAAVALKPGRTAAPEEIRDFVKERLAAYKYPRQVWIVDTLPKTATGKIRKRDITERHHK